MDSGKFFIFDASSYIYSNPNSNKVAVNALRHGLINIKPTHAAIILPPGREEDISGLIDISEYLGVSIYNVENKDRAGFVRSIIKSIPDGVAAIIASNDFYQYQHVAPGVEVCDLNIESNVDSKNIVDLVGVRPSQIIDLALLSGSPINEISGCPRISGSVASKMLLAHPSIEDIVKNKGSFSGPASRDILMFGDSIVELKAKIIEGNVGNIFDFDFDSAKRRKIQPTQLYDKYISEEVFLALPFDILKDISVRHGEEHHSPMVCHVDSIHEVNDLVKRISAQQTISFFFSESGRTLSLSTSQLLSFVIDFNKVDEKSTMMAMAPIFESNEVKKVTFNGKEACKKLISYGINIKGHASDANVVSYSLDNKAGELDLDGIGKHHDIALFKSDNCPGIKSANIMIANKLLYRKAISQGVHGPIQEFEMPLVNVIARMEHTGVFVDKELLFSLEKEFDAEIKKMKSTLSLMSGSEFESMSSKDISSFLFDKLQLKPPLINGKPCRQTNESVLSALKEQHEAPAIISRLRSISKLKSTYTGSLAKHINSETGRIHTTLNHVRTLTGRLSSSDPALQNIPIRTKEGRMIRRAFMARPGHMILSSDYSQIELRILAHLSGDKRLNQAFLSGHDVHAATASNVFNTPIEQVSKEMRRRAKAINFGLIYGMSAYGLSKELDISQNEAQKYIDAYFLNFEGVERYLNEIKKGALQCGYITTHSGRRIRLASEPPRDFPAKRAMERVATNTPMQGSAADIIKKAMISVDNMIMERGLSSRIIMQVHDELVLECPINEVKMMHEALPRLMEDAIKLSVPMTVDTDVGRNWEESHSLEGLAQSGHEPSPF